MRFCNKSSSRTSMAYLWKKREFRKILLTNLGLNSVDIEEFFLMNKQKNVLNIPRHRLINNCLTYQVCTYNYY